MKRKKKHSNAKEAPSRPGAGAAASGGQKPPETEEEAKARMERMKANAAFEHTCGVTVSLYGHQLEDVVGKDGTLNKSVTAFVVDLWERFKPRDAVEELLLTQMVQTHVRVMYLNALAQKQHNLKSPAHILATTGDAGADAEVVEWGRCLRPSGPSRSWASTSPAARSPTGVLVSDTCGQPWTARLAVALAMAFSTFLTWYWWDRPDGMSRLRRQRGQCLQCGYDLRGNVSGVCPECGGAAQWNAACSTS